jgi:predicted RNase H-like HicB family nuclease
MLAKFEAYFDGEYWCARGIGADVFTQGATLDELMDNIREAAELHSEDVLRQGERDGCQSSDRGTKEKVDRDVVK